MTSTLLWEEDPTKGTVQGEETIVYDEYAIWLLKWGWNFLPWAQLDRVKAFDSDYRYFLESPTLTTIKPPIANAVDFVWPQPTFTKRSQEPPKTITPVLPVIGALPVLKSAVVAEPKNVNGSLCHTSSDKNLQPENLVIVGVIDDGINVFNRRFTPKGRPCRIEYAWIQDALADQESSSVFFGAELTSAEITNALENDGLSEAELMAKYGLSPGEHADYRPATLNRPYSHGTAIADLAAGEDPSLSDNESVNIRLITVQLPALSVADTSGAALISAAHAAAIYIYERALKMSVAYDTAIPVILNFSFSISGGARTGHHFLEWAFKALGEKYQKDVMLATKRKKPAVVRVMAAGNENLMRLHADNKANADTLKLPLRILPDDHTSSFLEIWLPKDTDHVEIKITTPDGSHKVIDYTKIGKYDEQYRHKAHILKERGQEKAVLARVSLDEPLRRLPESFILPPLYWRILIAIAPTVSSNHRGQMAPFGLWKIDVTPCNKGRAIQAWVQKDTPVSGMNPLGRQPYLDDDDIGALSYEASAFDAIGDLAVDDPQKRTSVIARNGSLSGIAGNIAADGQDDSIVSVAAMRWDTYSTALYSGAAPDGAPMQAPQVMAIAEISRILPNLKCTGTMSGTASFINCTSAAAATVSRFLATQLSNRGNNCSIDFNPHNEIRKHGIWPHRPAGPEMATEIGVRPARLACNGYMLDLPATLSAYLDRQSRRK